MLSQHCLVRHGFPTQSHSFLTDLIIPFAFEAGLHRLSVQTALAKPADNRRGETVGDPDLGRAGCLYACQETGPIDMVRQRESAIECPASAGTADQHPP